MLLEELPHLRLGNLPTPLEELQRLTATLGVRILINCDDLTGLVVGGNKARKFQFLMADAKRRNADVSSSPVGLHSQITLA